MADEKSREIKRRYTRTALSDLAAECVRLGHEIATIKPRSYRERVELAEDAADALFEVHRRFDGGASVPGHPEMGASRDETVSGSFGAWYEKIKRSERQRVLVRAANWVLRDKADRWLRPAAHGDKGQPERYWSAMESDERLAEVLRELDAFPKRER